MQILIALIAGVLLAVVLVVISAPLRAARGTEAGSAGPASEQEQKPQAAALGDYERAELEAARETKYREIRDAELDLRTGKLSREDYEAIDSGLRAEALELLDRLEALEEERPGERTETDESKPELEG